MSKSALSRMKSEIKVCITIAIIISFDFKTFSQTQTADEIEVTIITTNRTGYFEKFWENTGLSAPGPGEETIDYLESKSQLFNLAIIGAIPYRGISHVRIHWLMDLISVRLATSSENVTYDFGKLDKLISWLYYNGLLPGFELMGNPDNFFSSLETSSIKVQEWRDLVYEIATHYKDKYGLAEFEKWRFETWNEPDLKKYNILNLTLPGYLKYVNASREGLKACSPKLQMYGPAGVFKAKSNHPICWGLLEFCEKQIIRNKSCLIDAVTFHKKGNGSVGEILKQSLQLYEQFKIMFPHLSNLPIANDESDVLTGWWKDEDWRGDVRYASAVCQSVALFHNAAKRLEIPLKYISNDNAFLNIPPSYFSQRTLLTRFVFNNTDGEYTDQFIRKPVYIAMAMLAYLVGDEVHSVLKPTNSRLSVLATCDNSTKLQSWSCGVIFILNADFVADTSKILLNINMKLPKEQDNVKYYIYLLDNNLTHPANVWIKAGRPAYPNRELLKKMRKAEGPHRIHASELEGDDLKVRLKVTSQSVTLLHVCSRPHQLPGQVVLLPAMNVTYNQVLLLWKDTNVGTRCIKTYEIEFCKRNCNKNTFKLINKRDIILLAFQYTPKEDAGRETTIGLYRVRAVDYWGQSGEFSNIISYGLA